MRARWRGWVCVAAAVAALSSSGCLALALGTAAAGGAASYAYVRGRITDEFPADLVTTWTAAHAALVDLGLPVLGVERSREGEGSLTSQTPDGKKVTVELEARPALPPVTRVHVRVGLWGDAPLSERLFNQMHARLTPAVQPVPVIAVEPPAPPPETAPPPLAAP